MNELEPCQETDLSDIQRTALNQFSDHLTILAYASNSNFGREYLRLHRRSPANVHVVKATIGDYYGGPLLDAAMDGCFNKLKQHPIDPAVNNEVKDAYECYQRIIGFWFDTDEGMRDEVMTYIAPRFNARNLGPMLPYPKMSHDERAVIDCAWSNRIDQLERLLDAGTAVDCRQFNGQTALYAAAGAGNHEIIRLLIEHGASIGPNEYDNMGMTPLHVASMSGGNQETLALLLEHIDVDTTDGFGQTPIGLAMWSNQCHVVECLLAFGASDIDPATGEAH